MRVRGSLRWIALALLGLVIAGAVALAASRLASQQIGIASESVSAGDSLAPPVTALHPKPKEDHGSEKPERHAEGERPESTAGQAGITEEQTEAFETPSIETSPPPTAGDDGGGGGGEGGGEGPDD
jgi:hypothetical protein